MFCAFRDKDGRKLLVFCVFKHIKGQEKMEDMKRFFVYMLERLYREEKGEQLTLLFDCRYRYNYFRLMLDNNFIMLEAPV